MSDMNEFEGQVETTDAKGLTRRGFLGAAAVAGAAAGLMAGPVGSAFASDPTASQIAWDFEADVLVIGSGPAGCSCAAWAARGGASVTVLEMNDKIGGKGVLAGGNLGIGGGTRLQQKLGYVETADIIFQDRTVENLRTDATMTVGDVQGGKHTVGLWRKISGAIDAEGMPRVFADKSLDTWNWLDGLGCPFLQANVSTYTLSYRGSRYFTTTAASPVDRTLGTAGMQAGGAGLIWPMYDDAVKHGAQFLLSHKMTKIIREGDRTGRVIGVEVFDSVNKKTVHFRARKAVFLGTGSWNGSKNLKVLFTPWLSKYPHISGEPYVMNDGSGVELAIEAGASLTTDRGSDWHGWHRHPGTIWHSITAPYGIPGVADPTPADVIYVNADGQRFMNEEIGEDNPAWVGGNPPFYFAQLCATQKTDADGPIVWIVMDDAQRALQNYTFSPGTDPKTNNVMPSMYATDATIAGLAAKIGVPAAALTTTITNYNAMVTAAKDTDFGKTKLTGQIATGPFHAVKWGIMKHNTIGGITINPKAQVMDWNSQVIPGLYAAGESAGGMDLIGLAKPIVFGRVAGEWAALETTTSPAATALTLKADHTALAHGGTVKLAAVLGGADGIPTGATVRFEVKAPGKSSFVLVKSVKVGAKGAAAVAYKLAKKGDYVFRARFLATPDFKAAASKSVKVVSK
jgi:succinate dehydrogenase/fumarate reductase flavoprotein subunit